ncbi:MAG TPA: hypothetical protein VGD98_07275 [Ktedonobacteraceae bacterium]
MNDLIAQLSTGNHQLVMGGILPSQTELKQRIEEPGYVFLTFTETRGQTNLGIRLDKSATDVSKADFANGTGSVHLEGTLTLDYMHVRCLADLDLATLQGTGHLEVLANVHP